MSRYLTPLNVQIFHREDIPYAQVRTVAGFAYRTQVFYKDGLDLTILIPVGFEFDGSSVPKFAQWMEHPIFGKGIYGSVIHDFAYFFHYLWVYNHRNKRIGKLSVSRRTADDLVVEAWSTNSPDVGILSLNNDKKWIMEKAVRVFGGYVWDTGVAEPRYVPPDLKDFQGAFE